MAAKSTPAKAAAKAQPAAKRTPTTTSPTTTSPGNASPESASPDAAAPSGSAQPKPAKSVPAPQTTRGRQTPAEAGRDEASEAAVPLNRAERRAKGRGKPIAQLPAGRGKVNAVYGPAHTQRNWANRRSG